MKTRIVLLATTILLGMKVIGFAQPVVIQFSSAQYTTSENGGGSATITVEITWGDPFNIYRVDYTTCNDSARAGADYLTQAGTLAFEYPETNKTFAVPILDDSRAEGDETILLTLRNPGFDASLGLSNAVLTIRDDPAWVVDDQFTRNIPGQSMVVRAFAVQPDGRIIVGGHADVGPLLAGSTASGIGRMHNDGSLDTSFDSGVGMQGDPSSAVTALLLQADGKVLLSGSFQAVAGFPRTNLARLNANGSLDTNFVADVLGKLVALQPDGKIFVSAAVIGQRQRLSRLNSNGTVDLDFAAGAGIEFFSSFGITLVDAVAVQSDGKAIVGGRFESVNGMLRTNLVRLMPDGTLDPGFAPVVDWVTSVAVVPDGKMVVAGHFSRVNGVAMPGLARLNPDGTLNLGFQPSFGGLHVSVANRQGELLILGGPVPATTACWDQHFWGVGRLFSDGRADTAYRATLGPPDPGGQPGFRWFPSVIGAVLTDDSLLLAGNFECINGRFAPGLARLLPAEDQGWIQVSALRPSAAGAPRLKVYSRPATNCIVEASSNLRDWTGVATNTVGLRPWEFEDTNATRFDVRFYRATQPFAGTGNRKEMVNR